MKLYLLKRDHQEGQTFYGVFESKELIFEQLKKLRRWMPNVPVSDYGIKEITLNELEDIEAYE